MISLHSYKTNKIAIVSSSLTGGGAEKIAVNLANYYSDLCYDIDLVLFRAKGEYIRQISPKVNIIDLKVKHIRFAKELNATKPMRKYLKTNKPHIVLSVLRTANIIVGLSSFGLDHRIIFREASTMHDVLNMAWFKRLIHLLIMKLSYKKADLVIANSIDTQNDLVKNSIIDISKIKVIPNPVLPENYWLLSKEAIDDVFLNDKDNKTIISIGRLVLAKNFPLLIEAFKKIYDHHPDTRLLIVGEGYEKENLLRKIKVLKLEHVVRIECFKQNIYPYIRNSNVFVSSSNWEGFGNVIVESLALGRPVVCTNCPGGPKSILENGKYGTLVPVEDPDSLANAIIESLGKNVDEKFLMRRGQEFSVRNVAKNYLKHLLSEHV